MTFQPDSEWETDSEENTQADVDNHGYATVPESTAKDTQVNDRLTSLHDTDNSDGSDYDTCRVEEDMNSPCAASNRDPKSKSRFYTAESEEVQDLVSLMRDHSQKQKSVRLKKR